MAALQDGIIILANEHFAKSLGVETTREIENSSLLDVTQNLDKNNLREFLKQAAAADKNQRNLPKLTLILKKPNGDTVAAEMFAYHSRLNGENIIEIYLVTVDDLKFKNRVRNIPWKLSISFLCILALTILPNIILPKLNINNAPATFLPKDSPAVILNNQVRNIFPEDEVIVLLFEGVALFSDGFINAYHDLTDDISNHEFIDDVISITRQDHISGSENGFLVEPLINVEELDDTHPREWLTRAINDRFARSSLVSSDGSAVAMVIIPQSLDNSILNLKLEEDILDLVKENQLEGYLTAMAGEITTDVEQMRMVLRDNMIFIPATVLMGLLLTWFLFHRLIAVVVTGVVTGAVVNSTIAYYVIFQQPFNTISGIIPPLLSALTIAALVHFYSALHYASKRGLIGKNRVDSALSRIKKPALFSALTTSVGLASLGLSPIPPISTFGIASAAGVLLIYLITIYLLPPIFTYFDNQPWPTQKSGLWLINVMVEKLFHFGIRKPQIVIGATVIALIFSVPFITRIKVETNILEFFPPSHQLRLSTNKIEHKLVGTTPMEVVFTSEEPSGLITPEKLVYLRQFQDWLANQAAVDKTTSIADFVEEMHWGFNAEKPEFRKIPDNPELISQYLFIYDGEDIYDFIDDQYQTARVVLNVNVHGANEISTLMDNIRHYLNENPTQNVTWEITGAGRMFADQEDLLIEGQVKSLGGALILIFVLMLFLWRSFKDTIICMIPNLSPVLLIFIVMGAFSIHLDLATAMIASVAVGIAIDDTVHVYHGFIHRLKEGTTPVIAIARTYNQAGRAVMTTTVILCSQFLLLLASNFVPMGNFGLLASIGLLAALIFDLMLLPALLVLFFKPLKPGLITTQ